jgi:hypothetical protein
MLFDTDSRAQVLESTRRVLRATIAFITHTALALVAAASIRGFEFVWELLFKSQEPHVMDSFPIRWIFEIGEASILCVFVAFGAVEAIHILFSRPRGSRFTPKAELTTNRPLEGIAND